MSNYCHNCGHYPFSPQHICTNAPRSVSTPVLDTATSEMSRMHSASVEANKRIVSLEAENAKLRKDAKRWKWARSNPQLWPVIGRQMIADEYADAAMVDDLQEHLT